MHAQWFFHRIQSRAEPDRRSLSTLIKASCRSRIESFKSFPEVFPRVSIIRSFCSIATRFVVVIMQPYLSNRVGDALFRTRPRSTPRQRRPMCD